ncbi:MAG TPA: carbon starvation protein A [archaeon]|nr:carbon starvation protein A [archaeon]
MNSLVIVVLGIILLYLAYIFYGTKISKLLDISDDNETPAISMNDGVDYVPTQPEVVFGHHFSSIAGAGPIIGPVVAAALFGWLPAFLWIVIGSIFIGGVHDMSSLIASMRHEGKSIASVAGKVMSKRAQLIFAAFIWLTLILIVAVFAVVAAQALINKPEIVLPTLMLIPIALLVGVMGFKFRIDTRIATALGLVLLFAFIYLGLSYPIELPVGDPFKYWVAILLVYAFIASVLPVWTLLQPRDYLASFVLFIGLGLGIIGLAIVRPVISTPAFITINSSQGYLWPILFVTIACGAVSGFHSLVSSGTTSKQIKKESDTKVIGYGAMLVEGLLAIVALLAVTAGLSWATSDLSISYPELLKQGWILTFGTGYGMLVEPIFGLALGTVVGMMVIKTFVMTTLDTASRLGRFVGTELFGSGGLGIIAMDNRYVSTLVLIVLAGLLALTGSWTVMWPVFGAANQLIAALTLFVVTIWLVGLKKPSRYTIYPGIFMLLTTIAALVTLALNLIPAGNYLLGGTVIILLVLSLLVVVETISSWKKIKASV